MTLLEAPHHQEEIFVFGVIFQTETASSLNFIEGRTSDQNTLTCSHARLKEQYSTYTKIVLIKANPSKCKSIHWFLFLHFPTKPMESETAVPFRPRSARLVAAATLPEVEFYFHLLVLIHLIDTECYNEVRKLAISVNIATLQGKVKET